MSHVMNTYARLPIAFSHGEGVWLWDTEGKRYLDALSGIAVLNAYAGEHVQLMVAEPRAVAERVTNGGAVFLGVHSPVALGDYCAGSNHVLPTGGCACHSSGLSVRAFTKSVHVVDYSRDALEAVRRHARSPPVTPGSRASTGRPDPVRALSLARLCLHRVPPRIAGRMAEPRWRRSGVAAGQRVERLLAAGR